MSKNQEKLIQEIQNLLDTEETDATELYNQLHAYRNEFHPDKFVDIKFKSEAEEKFKSIGLLLTELYKYLAQEKMDYKPGDLVLYKETAIDVINYKQTNINN